MGYDQLREILVNTESLYTLWKSTGMDEKEFILANGGLIQETEKARIQKEQTKARQVKFLEKQKAKGNRTLTAIVSGDTYDRLTRLRDKAIQAGEKKSLGEVLDQLLSGSKPDQKRPIVETQNEITPPDQAGQRTKHRINKPDVLKIMAAHREAGKTWQAIATALNEQDILTTSGVAWTGPNCQTFFKRSNK